VLPEERQPFTVDPALVERGLKGHADTQNELARILREAGLDPRSRRPQEPNFDLAWDARGTVFVAEVKSITDQNEEEQLRLGLGQVLRGAAGEVEGDEQDRRSASTRSTPTRTTGATGSSPSPRPSCSRSWRC
jgi:hypothetical protein